MKKRSVILKQQRTAKQDELKQLNDLATTEKRAFTAEEQTKWDAGVAEVRAFDVQIQQAEEAEALEAEIAARTGKPVSTELGDGEGKEKRTVFGQFRAVRAMDIMASDKELDGAEKEVNEIALSELRALGLEIPRRGINIPAAMMRNAYRADGQTVTQDSGQYGGVLVGEEKGEVLQPFLPRLTVEELGVKVITGLVGKYPLYSSDQFEFQNLDETEQADPQKVKYYKRMLEPKRTACVATVSNQLLIQSSIDVENDIRGKIATALDKRVFVDFINGSGVGPNPLGVLNDSILISAAAQGPLTNAKVVELLALIEDNDVPPSDKFAFLTRKLANLGRLIPVDAGSGIMLTGRDGNILGEKTFTSNYVPTGVGTGSVTTYPLIYGDWAQGRVLFWGGANIMTDPYTKADSNEVRFIINVHRNSGVANPKAFAVNKNITVS